MGKKSRKKKVAGGDAKKAAAIKRETRRSVVDRHGRMPEVDRRRFCNLLDFVALAVIDRVEEERQSLHCVPVRPLGWPPRNGFQTMEDDSRAIVVSYIMRHIDEISSEVDSGVHNDLFQQCMDRRMEDSDRNTIRSWKIHVEDDFVLVDQVPLQGTTFVQVGRLPEFEKKEECIWKNEDDIHPPRVFVVQGLAIPLAEMAKNYPLKRQFPSIGKKYGDLPIAIFHATILPYLGALTYACSLQPPACNYYNTPQQHTEAARIAVEAYNAALNKNSQNSELQCQLYKSLDGNDMSLVRHARGGTMENLVMESALLKNDLKYFEPDPNATPLRCMMVIWQPFLDAKDHRMTEVIRESAFGDRPLKVIREGFKHQAYWQLCFHDDQPCPFHIRMGVAISFAKCCKKKHLKRVAKAKKKGSRDYPTYLPNPPEKEEAKWLGDNLNFSDWNNVRIGVTDCSIAKLVVPLGAVDIVKERLDDAPIFLAIMKYKWLFLGWSPSVMHGSGITTFGDVSIDPQTGEFVGDTMTSDRMTALVREMRFVCTGIPIGDVNLCGQELHRAKPSKSEMERNVNILSEGLESKGSISINKDAIGGKVCEFCGLRDEKLLKCACKSAFYCSVDHQRLHWKDHKDQCRRLRNKK